MAETRHRRSLRARAILRRLARAMPGVRTALEFGSPMELLAAVLLSAQCTDVRVNRVTPALFARFRTPADFARADPAEIEPLVRPCGLFRTKARALVGCGRALVERHRGEVPTSREALARLPGVGSKTAGVVAMQLAGELALPVDTHIGRVARRLGLTSEADPDHVESDLRRLLPSADWQRAHHLLIWHGRRVCAARAPRCGTCPVRALCPRRGVGQPARR